MLEYRQTACVRQARSSRRQRRPFAAIACALLLAALGCQSTHYRASDMPDQLRAPSQLSAGNIDLTQMTAAGVGTSQIGAGDLVEITIVSGRSDERPTPVPARVAHDGTVHVPLIGPVNVEGLEPLEAEQRIAAAAVERGVYRRPYVTLKLTDRAVNRVTVLGAVTKPGVVALPRGSSDLLNALAAAGGMSKEAGTRVDVMQHGPPATAIRSTAPDSAQSADIMQTSHQVEQGPSGSRTTRVDLAQLAAGANSNFQLGDRDVVMVLPKEKQVFHVAGLVHKPNQFELDPGQDVHVLDAIALAGGTTLPIADKIIVIRQMPDMPEPAVIKVSIAEAKRNGRENLRLMAGDMVSVESTVTTMAVDTVSKFVRFAVGFNGSLAAF